MLSRRDRPRLAAALGTAALVLATVSGPVPRATADTFSPPSDPPVVTSLSISSDEGGTFTGITPASPTSDAVYTVSAQITVPATLVGIEEIQLCIWLDSGADCDADYSATEPDPQTVLIADWSWDTSADNSENTDDYATWTEQFQMTGTNNHALDAATSQTTYTDRTSDTTMDIDFSFTVSRAMRHSNNWTVRVAVVDESSQRGERSLENLLVNYFGAVTTDRPAISFGALDDANTTMSTKNDESLGAYVANSQSDITIEATDFTDGGSNTLPLAASVNNADQKNQRGQNGSIVLRCSPGASFDSDAAQIIDAGAEFFGPAVSVISSEAPESIGSHSCRLEFPFGQVNRPNVSYSNTVTVAIGADEVTAPGNLTATSSSDGTLVTLQWDQPIAVNESGVDLTNYVVERSTDGGSTYSVIETIASGFTNQMSTTDGSRTPGDTYHYRVTANIADVGAGTSSTSVTTDSTGQTFNLLADLNSDLSTYRANTSASTVVTAIENNGLKVFASPALGSMAESMGSQSGTISSTGVFSTGVMQRTGSSYYLAESEGFGNSTLNGHPYIGFVAMTNSEYLGSGVMLYRDYDSTTNLRELFSPNAYRNLYAAVLDNGQTTEGGLEEYTNSSMRTIFSDNQRPGYYGYYRTNEFSSDDGIWGFSGSGAVNGDSPGPDLTDYSDGRFGIQNYNSGDSSYQSVFWDNRTISNNGGVMYFFVLYN